MFSHLFLSQSVVFCYEFETNNIFLDKLTGKYILFNILPLIGSQHTFKMFWFCYIAICISCNNVALPYFKFLYLPGFTTIPWDLYCGAKKKMPMHYLLFPMICTLCFPENVNTSHLILYVDPFCAKDHFQSVKLHCHIYYRETWGSANYPKESICKTYYSNR